MAAAAARAAAYFEGAIALLVPSYGAGIDFDDIIRFEALRH